MRDFKSGDNHGNINIIDNSNNNKLLTTCNDEELLEEEKYRQGLIKAERNKRNTKVLKFIACSIVMLFIAVVNYYFFGELNLFNSITGGVGLVIIVVTFRFCDKPSAFEERQLAILKEINMLLRERGAR